MHLTNFLALASLTLVLAVPARPNSERKGLAFSVEQHANPKYNGSPIRRVRRYNRSGRTLRRRDNGDVFENEEGSFSASSKPDVGELQWLTPIKVGGQSMNVLIDTGSTDLWVYSTYIPGDIPKERKLFDASRSASFKRMEGFSWNLTYQDMSYARGIVGTDVLEIGGQKLRSAIVEVATDVSDEYRNATSYSGILGLSFQSLSAVVPARQENFVFQYLDMLHEKVFSVDLRHDAAGSFDFGFIDDSRFKGNLSWSKVDASQGRWQFTMPSIKVGNISYPLNAPAVADTGTTDLVFPKAIVDKIFKDVKGAKWMADSREYFFPCGAVLPDMSIELSPDHFATIKGSTLEFRLIDKQTMTCNSYVSATNDDPDDFTTLGDPLFKSQYVVFDAGKYRLGFGHKAERHAASKAMHKGL